MGLTNTINTHYTLIVQEKAYRTQHVQTLFTLFDQQRTEVQAQVVARQAGDLRLQNQQNVDRASASVADVVLHTRVDTEALSRQQGDAALGQRVTDKSNTRQEGITTLIMSKMDVSPCYPGGRESFQDQYQSILVHRGPVAQSGRPADQDFRTAVPFIRGA